MNLQLSNKNTIVFESYAGIGKASAIELVSLVANIALVARNEDKLKQVLEEATKVKNYHILMNNTEGPILTADEDVICENNVFQWLFGDNEKKKQDLVNKILN